MKRTVVRVFFVFWAFVLSACALQAQNAGCAFMQLPYFENFESIAIGAVPQCWLRAVPDTAGVCDLPSTVASSSHDGQRSLRIACSTAEADNSAALPAVDSSVAYVEISFWAASVPDSAASPSTLAVGLMPDADTLSVAVVQEYLVLPADGQYRRYTVLLALPDSGAWRPTLGVVAGAGCFVDGLAAYVGASCMSPQGLALDWVDSNAAHLVWQPAADSCLWLVRIGGADPFEHDTNDLLLTGLDANSNVHVELRAVCRAGDTTDVAVLDFHTACGAMQLPLVENFNVYRDDEDPYCWSVAGRWHGSDGTAYPHVVSYTFGEDAVYLMQSDGDGAPVGLVSPVMAPAADRLHVMFRLSFGGPGTFVAGLMQHTDSAFFPVLTVANSSVDAAGHQPWFDYEFYTDTVSAVSLDSAYRVAFFWTGTAPVRVDDISLLPAGPCHAPTDAHIDTAYADTVVLVWEDFSATPAGYEVRYGQTLYVASASMSVMTYDATIAIGGLEPSSTYGFWVRALCPADSARWLFIGSTHTECGSVNLPYVYTFDGDDYEEEPCWMSDADGATSRWFRQSQSLYMYVAVGDSMIVATPLLRAPADELRVSFKAVSLSTILQVGVVDDTLGGFVPLYTVYPDEGDNQTHIFYTDQLPTSDTMRLAFRIQAGSYSTALVDDLAVFHQRCHDPLGVWVDSVASDMAFVHIDDPSDAGFYRLYTAHNGIVDSFDVADTIVTLTMLESGSDYTVSAAAICYDGSLSQPVGASFRTYCPYLTHTELPYEQPFDSLSGAGVDVPCWVFMTPGAGYGVQQAEGDASPSLTVSLGGTGSAVYASMPAVDVVDDLMVRFEALNTLGSAAMAEATIEVGIMQRPDDDLTFFPLDTVYCPATGQWHTYEVLLTSYAGTGHWPALRIKSPVATEVRIDNVWLGPVPTCSGSINSVRVSNVWSYSADIEWDVDVARNIDASYTIHIETDDGQPAGDFFVDSTSYTICNLDALTAYRVWVEMYCGGEVQVASDRVPFTTRCDNTQSVEQSAFSNQTMPYFTSPIPISAEKRFSASQQLFSAAEFDNLPSTITGIDLRYCNDAVPLEVVNCSIYLAPCYADTLAQWQTSGQVLVYAGPLLFDGNDWHTVYFSAPYEYDGVGNLLLTVVAESRNVNIAHAFGSYNTGRQVSLLYNSDYVPFNDTMDVNISYMRSDARFLICPGEVPTCASPVLGEVVASSDYIGMAYDAGGAMCQMSISQGWIWSGEVLTVDNSGLFTFDSLEPVTNYIVGVRRICPGMTSNWSTRVVRTLRIACDEPSGLTATDVTSAEAVIRFNANGADRWQLHLFNFRIDTVFELTDSVFELTDLVPDVTYHVAVRSLCGLAYGLHSDWVDTIEFTTGYCQPVTGASVVADGLTAAVVRWSPSANAETYRVEYGLRDFVRGEAIGSYTTDATMLRIEGLEPDQRYDFYVATVCDDGSRSVWTYAGGVPPVGIDASAQHNEPQLRLSPNPASSYVGVATDAPAMLTFYDVEGRMLLRAAVDAGTQSIDISSLPRGTCFVRATSALGTSVGKLVVR